MTAISLLIGAMIAWMPMVDGQRVFLDAQAEVPYWLGISVPPPEIVSISVLWGGEAYQFDNLAGTHSNLLYIDDYCQVEFYEYGVYSGKIVPEPATLIFLLSGIFLCRKYGRNEK